MQIGYDYSNFDATKEEYNNYIPEPGNHNIQLLSGEEKQVENKGSLMELEFINEGDDKSYTVAYLTGWQAGDYMKTRQIAYESIGKLYYGITGQQPPANGFDLTQLFGHTFNADVEIEEYNDKKYIKLKRILPIAGNDQPAQAQGGGNTAQPQQAAPQAQTYGKPTWA